MHDYENFAINSIVEVGHVDGESPMIDGTALLITIIYINVVKLAKIPAL